MLNETLTTTTTSTQTPLTNNRIDRQDRNEKALFEPKNMTKTTFDPLRVYKKFGDMINASMRIIVHGFGSNCRHEWIDEMRAALMAVEECFVMCVEWEKGAILPKQVLKKLIQYIISFKFYKFYFTLLRLAMSKRLQTHDWSANNLRFC